MKITVPHATGPALDEELLLRFIIKKCKESIRQNRKEIDDMWMSMALAAVHRDPEFYERVKAVVSASPKEAEEVLSLCRDTFMPSLKRLQNGYSHPSSGEENEYPCPDEAHCGSILSLALREGKSMLADKDYEFVKVFEVLVWIGLQCYPMRLYQFEAIICQSCTDDPQNLLKIGIEIIKNALGSSKGSRKRFPDGKSNITASCRSFPKDLL